MSFGGDVHIYDWPWQGEGFIKLVLWKGCANTMDSWRVKGFIKKIGSCGGHAQIRWPLAGSGVYKMGLVGERAQIRWTFRG